MQGKKIQEENQNNKEMKSLKTRDHFKQPLMNEGVLFHEPDDPPKRPINATEEQIETYITAVNNYTRDILKLYFEN